MSNPTDPPTNLVGGWNSGAGSVPRGYPASAVDAPSGAVPNPDARVQKWADVAMWNAPKHEDPQKPKVTVSMCTRDPLGTMAMVNAQYTGRNLLHPSDVTDAERREAWEAATVSMLSTAPLEWVQWSINFENVSRAFTHQLVRTRMATYAQESMRFGVKDNVGDEVKLPPSLTGTLSWHDFQAQCETEGVDPEINASTEQKWRNRWDRALTHVADAYAVNVAEGMPAEDARGLLPTNILTRIHMRTDMKTLLGLAGLRLCTQAQHEWRAVFAELAKAIRTYGALYDNPQHRWQYELIADSFRPVCYTAGKCTMKAKSDRYCSIRERVDAFEAAGIPSRKWDYGTDGPLVPGIKRIQPAEWLLDPTAARVAP